MQTNVKNPETPPISPGKMEGYKLQCLLSREEAQAAICAQERITHSK